MNLREKTFQRLKSLSHRAKRSLGQNFLVSDSVITKIMDSARCGEFERVIEIGPGLGALTDELLVDAEDLLLIELDRIISDYWELERGVPVVNQDALSLDWDSYIKKGSTLIIGNLPYQISSRLVIDLSLLENRPTRMVYMFQKEVAQRITAEANTKDYSLLTLIAQLFWRPTLVLEAGSVDFFPKPRVASRVLKFETRKNAPKVDGPEFLKFAKVCFAQRRKKLLTQLKKAYGDEMAKESLNSLSVPDGVRVGQLDPQQLLALFYWLQRNESTNS